MHLGLTHQPSSFQDGTGSWNGSAADALGIWNQYINKVQFVSAGATTNHGNDGQNSAFFSNTIYGQTFGANVLAVTLNYSGPVASETDVIFNDKLKWGSYRGPLQFSGNSYLEDFHRVALHEFGHVLGLDHPDESNQSVEAIMNSIISNLDHLADDDIAGARSLYGLSITSPQYPQTTRSGDQFSYQVTANNNPTNYSATGLPAGLQIDSATGLISGRSTASGTFNVTLVVQGSSGTATGVFQLIVYPLSLTSSTNPPSIVIGDSFSYQIAAGNSPTAFSATGLPAGLTINTSTGLISGTPTLSGNFYVVVKATGASSEAGGTVTIVVSPPSITSAYSTNGIDIGSSVTYQITANNHPTSFAAANLPPGLQLDAATGVISGVATLSGNYPIIVTAHGAIGDATGPIFFSILSLISPTAPLAKVALDNSGTILADPVRERVYVTQYNAIAVLDSKTFVLLKTVPITGSLQAGLSISADGKRLWISGYYSPMIQSIDLDTLTVLPTILTSIYPRVIRGASDGSLYLLNSNDTGIYHVDQNSGAILQRFTPDAGGMFTYCGIEISPDRKTLYATSQGLTGTLAKYDVSTGSPVLNQRVQVNSYELTLAVAPDGQSLILPGRAVDTGLPAAYVRSTVDLNIVRGAFTTESGNGPFTISPDSRIAFQSSAYATTVSGFDLSSGNLSRTIGLPDRATISQNSTPAFDGTNSYLFILTMSAGRGAIYVYPAVPPPSPPAPPKTLLNVSTRLRSQTGDNVLIGGFIITGTEAKKVVLRATGPSLPIVGKLTDPTLELHGPDGSLLAANDNWNEHRAEVLATDIVPKDEHEAAIVTTLPPGGYTAILRGVASGTGVALIELYDLNAGSNSRIANISTRGRVETGDNVMIGGFIIGGDQPTKVIVRAVGPSLATQGVTGALTDTTLSLHDGNGVMIASNDDWGSDQEQEITATNLAPKDSRESAVVRTLAPGNYTAIIRGKSETSGVALVEVYNLESN